MALQRKIASRNIKQGGILIKFQNQSSRVFDFIVESVMGFIHIFCLFALKESFIERAMSGPVVQTGRYSESEQQSNRLNS